MSDIEEASRRIQAAGGRGHYLTPIVAGTGMGAAVAYAALAQAPDATLAGAASDGFTTRVATKTAALRRRAVKPGGRRRLRVRPGPPARLVARGARRRRCGQGAGLFADAAGAAADAVVTARRRQRLGARLQRCWRPARAAAAETLAGLPLVELPVSEPGRLMAVVYSGDGGWRDIDKDIAGRLQAKGIPVVGVDSLRYFWSEKTPEQVAARPRPDHRPLPRRLAAAGRAADRLLVRRRRPALRLQPAARRPAGAGAAAVAAGLHSSADFEIHVTGWLGVDSHEGSVPTAAGAGPAAAGLVQCFYGEEEEDTACPLPLLKGAQIAIHRCFVTLLLGAGTVLLE